MGPRGGPSAAYLTIANGAAADDALVGVGAPDLSASVSLHETTRDDGMTGMHHAVSIAIPARGSLALEPGGTHVMLEALQRQLVAGDTVQLVLTFERAGPVTVDARVRAP
jgi:periplasmic copper chaperone A